jgi:hypothetical protein
MGSMNAPTLCLAEYALRAMVRMISSKLWIVKFGGVISTK